MHNLCCLSALSCGNRLVCCVLKTCSLECRYSNHRASELLRELIKVNLIPCLFKNIDHIYCHDNRYAKLKELCCQIQVTLNVGCID